MELILDLMANGWTEKMIFESYPQLTPEDLRAVFAYLKEGMETELYFTIPKSA